VKRRLVIYLPRTITNGNLAIIDVNFNEPPPHSTLHCGGKNCNWSFSIILNLHVYTNQNPCEIYTYTNIFYSLRDQQLSVRFEQYFIFIIIESEFFKILWFLFSLYDDKSFGIVLFKFFNWHLISVTFLENYLYFKRNVLEWNIQNCFRVELKRDLYLKWIFLDSMVLTGWKREDSSSIYYPKHPKNKAMPIFIKSFW
jgi:hypothetical protein